MARNDMNQSAFFAAMGGGTKVENCKVELHIHIHVGTTGADSRTGASLLQRIGLLLSGRRPQMELNADEARDMLLPLLQESNSGDEVAADRSAERR